MFNKCYLVIIVVILYYCYDITINIPRTPMLCQAQVRDWRHRNRKRQVLSGRSTPKQTTVKCEKSYGGRKPRGCRNIEDPTQAGCLGTLPREA